jgi:hypothetical protein
VGWGGVLTWGWGGGRVCMKNIQGCPCKTTIPASPCRNEV